MQYGMTELQDLAYDGIVSRLTPEIIVAEAFSSFFARLVGELSSILSAEASKSEP